MPSQPGKAPIILLVIALEIVSLVLVILYRMELFRMSLGFIYDYQRQQTSDFVIDLWNIMSVLGSILITGILAFLHFFLKRKLVTLIMILYLLFNTYVLAMQKIFYQDTRPFLFSLEVIPLDWSCQAGYGFPSGHSWTGMYIYQIVVTDLVGNKGWKKLFLVFVLLIGFMNPLSRLVLGSHSGDQIVYGIFNSLASMVLFRYALQYEIYKVMKNALNHRHFRAIFTITTVFYVITTIIPIVMYEVNTQHRPIDQVFIDNFQTVCGKTTNQFKLERDQAITVNIVSLPLGAIYGLLISCKKSQLFEHVVDGVKRNFLFSFLVGNWNYGGIRKIVKYILINGAFVIVFLGIFTRVIPTFLENFYAMFFINLIGFTATGVSLTFFIPYLLIKYGAIDIVIPDLKSAESETRLNNVVKY